MQNGTQKLKNVKATLKKQNKFSVITLQYITYRFKATIFAPFLVQLIFTQLLNLALNSSFLKTPKQFGTIICYFPLGH